MANAGTRSMMAAVKEDNMVIRNAPAAWMKEFLSIVMLLYRLQARLFPPQVSMVKHGFIQLPRILAIECSSIKNLAFAIKVSWVLRNGLVNEEPSRGVV